MNHKKISSLFFLGFSAASLILVYLNYRAGIIADEQNLGGWDVAPLYSWGMPLMIFAMIGTIGAGLLYYFSREEKD